MTDAPATRRSRARAAVRNLAADVTPLRRSRDFRLLWTGLLVSESGHQFTIVATFVQVRNLTHSTLAVGVIGLVGVIALVVGTLIAGQVLDVVDRRRLLIAAQFSYMAAAGLLLAGALIGDPPLVLIYAGVALLSATSAIDGPARNAMTPRLVGRDLVPAAAALNQIVWQVTALVGPALAGVVIATLGLEWAYGIDLVTYGAMLLAALAIRPVPPERSPDAKTGWAAVREGFGYLRGRPALSSTFIVDIIAMVFGMPRALFPFLAANWFGGGAGVVGLLFSAPAVGALVAASATGWIVRIRHQGQAVLWSVALWGLGITAFAFTRGHLALALLCLAFAGGADVISAVFRNTILQLSVPDALRGRLSGIHILVVTGGPRLGDLEAGAVASVFSPFVSVLSGGLLCVAGTVLLALFVPAFRRYHAGDPA
ncbi:MAG: MFS transporter [Actinomycetota bacterium]